MAFGRDARRGTEGLGIGLYVAAAGFGTSGLFLDADLASELDMLGVNCRAVLETTHHLTRAIRRRRRAGIVLMSSLVGRQGTPNAAHYAATKAYVHTLAEALHEELGPDGIDVIACAPGPVYSGFAQRAGMHMGPALTPQQTVAPTLRALLRRRATVAPGALSQALTLSLAPLPRRARVKIMGSVMASMTNRQR